MNAQKRYYYKNRESILAKKREYYHNNKELCHARYRAWYEFNYEYKKEYDKKRYIKKEDQVHPLTPAADAVNQEVPSFTLSFSD